MADLKDLITEQKSLLSYIPPTTKPKQRVNLWVDQGSLRKTEEEPRTLEKALDGLLSFPKNSVERLAFEVDPGNLNRGLNYIQKPRGLPTTYIKRLLVQDELVSCCVRARETQMSLFGYPRPDPQAIGFILDPNVGVLDKMSEEQLADFTERKHRAVKMFTNCGETDGIARKDQMSLSQWFQLSVRNAVGIGWLATELVYITPILGGTKRFHHFRPSDAGTIYYATPGQKVSQDSIREGARNQLERIAGIEIPAEPPPVEEYAWIQVIEGQQRQAFTDKELAVYNFYPVADVEQQGYPVPPVDVALSSISQHINITKHNGIYFQNGRAARGLLIFKSEEVDQVVMDRIQQMYQASVNGVNNSWRIPIFSVSRDDEVQWQQVDSTGRDGEFEYLSDANSRAILSAFQLAPDELAGYSYLSHGTGSQQLSESNNEYRTTASRDQGIRPIISKFEAFINTVIFPLIDPELARLCTFKMTGLDAESEEKRDVRLTQAIPVHMTINEVLRKVEKEPLPKEFASDILMNPQWQSILFALVPVGKVVEYFLGVKGASQDPDLQYYRDPLWLQSQQLKLQMAQLQAQQDAQAAQAQQAQQPPQEEQSEEGDDLSTSVDQALGLLSKSERELPQSKKKLLAMQRHLLSRFRAGLDEDLKEATKEIAAVVESRDKK